MNPHPEYTAEGIVEEVMNPKPPIEQPKQLRKYTRRIKVNIKCNDGNTFVLSCGIQVQAYDYGEAGNNVKKEFPIMLQRSLASGITITKLDLL